MSQNFDTETKKALEKIMKNTTFLVQEDIHGSQFGSDYYNKLDETGLIDTATSLGANPTTGSINRYYDESRNLSVLSPTLDPFNIMNVSRQVKENIQKNDFSESYFFSSEFDKQEIEARFREKKLMRSKLLEYFRLQEIKQKHPMEQLISLNLLILDKLDNILRYNTKQYILDKIERRPVGKMFFCKTTLVFTEQTTKIVFTDESKVKNRPTGGLNMTNFPSTELFSLVVRVDSGGPVTIATNESDTNYNTYVELKANEEHKVEEDSALIKSINLRANDSNAAVRIIGLY